MIAVIDSENQSSIDFMKFGFKTVGIIKESGLNLTVALCLMQLIFRIKTPY
jgi:L-amino acid N-acyltransferase YncA